MRETYFLGGIEVFVRGLIVFEGGSFFFELLKTFHGIKFFWCDFFRGVEFVSRGLFSCKWIIFCGMVDVLSGLMGVAIISGEGSIYVKLRFSKRVDFKRFIFLHFFLLRWMVQIFLSLVDNISFIIKFIFLVITIISGVS